MSVYRLINPQTMMLGQEPRQTTSNLGHLNKPSIQALIHGLNRHYYSIAINYRQASEHTITYPCELVCCSAWCALCDASLLQLLTLTQPHGLCIPPASLIREPLPDWQLCDFSTVAVIDNTASLAGFCYGRLVLIAILSVPAAIHTVPPYMYVTCLIYFCCHAESMSLKKICL